ncbi:hypothetical protein ES705_33992 [subsurface metagenome]
MKNLSLLVITIFLFISANAQKIQKLKEYKASNGITYKVGDEIKLGRGSNDNGNFVYVTMGGWAAANGDVSGLGPGIAGLIVTVKKIKKYNYKRYKGVYFTVGGGNITNYNLDIENAILTCEIQDCKKNDVAKSDSKESSDMYAELKKLKELYDNGILTKEEYEKEKKEILDKNN